MNDQYPHLGPLALPYIELPAETRVAQIRKNPFNELPRARRMLDLIDGAVESKGNLLFWGESGAGKTTIIEQYVKEHPSWFDATTGITVTPVVSLLMTPECNPKWLLEKLLEAVKAPQPLARPSIAHLESRIIELYGLMNVRLIILDEVHDMLVGTARQQRIMLNVIRHLINQLDIPLVLFGIDKARTALILDPQLDRRFSVHNFSSWVAGEEFNTLVGSILRSLPLRRPSVLSAKALRALVSYSQGKSYEIFEPLRALAISAIRSGTECITAADVLEFIEMKALSHENKSG